MIITMVLNIIILVVTLPLPRSFALCVSLLPGIDRNIETPPLVLLFSFLFLPPFTPPHLFLPLRPRIRIKKRKRLCDYPSSLQCHHLLSRDTPILDIFTDGIIF